MVSGGRHTVSQTIGISKLGGLYKDFGLNGIYMVNDCKDIFSEFFCEAIDKSVIQASIKREK